MMTSFFATQSVQADPADRELFEMDRARQRAGWVESGYTCLGYTQVAQKDNGRLVGFAWTRTQPEDVRGLPAGLVDQARAAVMAAIASRQAYADQRAAALRDAERQGLDATATNVLLQLRAGEAWSAAQAAERALEPALGRLGQVAEQAREARTILREAPARRQAIELQAQRALAQVDQEEQAARTVLLALGASE